MATVHRLCMIWIVGELRATRKDLGFELSGPKVGFLKYPVGRQRI